MKAKELRAKSAKELSNTLDDLRKNWKFLLLNIVLKK